MHGQKVINLVCNECEQNMPDLEDTGHWNTSECSNCGNWYDFQNAMKNGGKLID